jgi:hypothetical protein
MSEENRTVVKCWECGGEHFLEDFPTHDEEKNRCPVTGNKITFDIADGRGWMAFRNRSNRIRVNVHMMEKGTEVVNVGVLTKDIFYATVHNSNPYNKCTVFDKDGNFCIVTDRVTSHKKFKRDIRGLVQERIANTLAVTSVYPTKLNIYGEEADNYGGMIVSNRKWVLTDLMKIHFNEHTTAPSETEMRECLTMLNAIQ